VKPGVEQVLVTQLFLDVQMTIHRHEHLVLNRVDDIFELIFESEMCMHDIRGEPRPTDKTPDTMSLAAWETTPNAGGPNLGAAITLMNVRGP
jgi:ssRNA-specific RNase YbeY (16S rRNA maturation enzyme)